MSEVRELPFVSIVICTYNRKKFLKDCLNSIFAMDYPQSLYEVIVVDGGSTDGTAELCKEFPNIQFVVEDKHGLAYARNKGAELSRGIIVAYTDDDCIVDKLWLKNLIEGFRFSRSIVGVGGPVYPLHPELVSKKILVKAALGLFDDGEKIKLTRSIITSNAAFKKDIFKNIKFDEKLGVTRRGKILLSGEDTDFCHTISDYGYKLLYTPFAKVYHQINEKRLRVPYIINHAVQNGIAQARIYLKRKNSRIYAVRCSIGLLMRQLLKIPLARSFVFCYNLVYSLSALITSITSLDKIF